ncbi:hypothetical protein [Leptospira ilyithenensis]|uniref:hypothetical protein n=1 Tax=Leptospira ilyithenensis TaxID=2484901 RepID=UPI00319DACC1
MVRGLTAYTLHQYYCKQNGVEEVFLQADLGDDYAIEFYRSTGTTPESVVHFYYPLHM